MRANQRFAGGTDLCTHRTLRVQARGPTPTPSGVFARPRQREDNGRVELAERLQELRADRRHGASFLARRASEALVEVAEAPAATSEELLERVTSAARILAAARPGVAAVAGAVGRLLAAVHAEKHLAAAELRRLIE